MPTLQNDIVEISAKNRLKEASDTEKKSGMSAGAKLTLGGVLAAILGVGIWCASRGKVRPKPVPLSAIQEANLEKLISTGKIDKQSAELFKMTNGLEIDEWLPDVYKKMCKDMGYRFSHDVPRIKISQKFSTGGNSDINKITLYMQGEKTTYSDVIGTLRHELEHFRQKDLVYRTFGEQAYIDAEIQPMLKRLKYNSQHCQKITGKKYSDLTQAELDNYIESCKNKLRENCSKLRDLRFRKGDIAQGSNEYNEAKKYLDAMKNYESPFMYEDDLCVESIKNMKKTDPKRIKFLQDIYKKYENNELEICANKKGDELKKMYQIFVDEIKMNKN